MDFSLFNLKRGRAKKKLDISDWLFSCAFVPGSFFCPCFVFIFASLQDKEANTLVIFFSINAISII